MPSWKRVIVGGSDASLNSLNIAAALTASGLSYPSTDGTAGQALVTDGSGHLSFTTLDSGGVGSSVKLSQTAAATTWSFEHNLNEKFPAVTIYDSNDEVIIPQKIDAIDNDNMLIYFSTPRTGTAAAVVGGSTVSASFALSASHAQYALTASYLEGYISPFPFTGSALITGSLGVTGSVSSTGGFTGSLQGNAATATSASYALTASHADNFTVSGSISGVQYVDFNTGSAAPTWKSGRVFWDNTEGALSVYNAEADITLQVGQENWTRVWNSSGGIIHNGDPVRITGTHGDHPEVVLAQAIQVSGSSNIVNQILGVATHDIEVNTFGYITTQGLVRGLNTNAFNDGDTLYVSSSAGQYTTTVPTAPYEIIPVGQVVKAGPGTSGIIYVAVQQPLDFTDLSSVHLGASNYADGELWSYDGPSKSWRHTRQLSGSYALTGSLEVQGTVKTTGSVQVGDNSDTASSTNVGSIRYRTSGNNSYVDMVMQTGASTYTWVNIVQNNW